MLDGTELPTLGTLTLPIEVGGTHTDVLFHCVRNLPSPILLGIDFVQAANLVLDFGQNCYWTKTELGPCVQLPILVDTPTLMIDDELTTDEHHQLVDILERFSQCAFGTTWLHGHRSALH